MPKQEIVHTIKIQKTMKSFIKQKVKILLVLATNLYSHIFLIMQMLQNVPKIQNKLVKKVHSVYLMQRMFLQRMVLVLFILHLLLVKMTTSFLQALEFQKLNQLTLNVSLQKKFQIM